MVNAVGCKLGWPTSYRQERSDDSERELFIAKHVQSSYLIVDLTELVGGFAGALLMQVTILTSVGCRFTCFQQLYQLSSY